MGDFIWMSLGFILLVALIWFATWPVRELFRALIDWLNRH